MNSVVALIPDDTVEQRVLGIVHVHCLSTARLAQSVERKALNLVVVGSSRTVGVLHLLICSQHMQTHAPRAFPIKRLRTLIFIFMTCPPAFKWGQKLTGLMTYC